MKVKDANGRSKLLYEPRVDFSQLAIEIENDENKISPGVPLEFIPYSLVRSDAQRFLQASLGYGWLWCGCAFCFSVSTPLSTPPLFAPSLCCCVFAAPRGLRVGLLL